MGEPSKVWVVFPLKNAEQLLECLAGEKTYRPALRGVPHRLLRGLPSRSTLNNQPHLLLQGKRHKPACSTCTIKTAIFFFIVAPFFIGHQSKHCFHNGQSESAVEY